MEIPVGAKKCPYCQYFQKPLSAMLSCPATGIFLFLIIFCGLGRYYLPGMFYKSESYTNYVGQVQVVESKIQFGEGQCGPTVVVLGKAHNVSPLGWKSVVFHVDIFDAEGNPVDMAQEEKYSYIIPSGKTQSFKVTFPRQFPLEKYAKHEISVVSAKDAKSMF
jgi:hypothetical protein